MENYNNLIIDICNKKMLLLKDIKTIATESEFNKLNEYIATIDCPIIGNDTAILLEDFIKYLEEVKICLLK